ncbi:MAG: hypothetical protein DPW17_15510, partial [Candidatus Jettenia sp.]|nr:hypothetical protein [Candidatus Jettenia sp.]
MKITNTFLGYVFLVFTQVFFLFETGLISAVSANDTWKSWYGITVDGSAESGAKYARQMGYD